MASVKYIQISIIMHIFILRKVMTEDTRIVGGEDSKKQYPYQISLQVRQDRFMAWLPQDEWVHNCGGSIVTSTCVVSAAHCVVNYTADQLSVLAGTNQLKGGGGVRYQIKNVKIHPKYKELKSSDIAVMRIDKSFTFGDTIAPIAYSDEIVGGGVNCTLTGWGYNTPIRFGNPPNQLQRVVLPTITNQECKEKGLKPSETEICTFSHFGQGACGGDSGGPLTIGDGQELIGIVSYGARFCATGMPDAFTRVSMFTDWIRENCEEVNTSIK